jgi:hypothetical protein
MDGSAIRQRVLEVLLQQIEEGRFPSATMMGRVEAELRTPEQVLAYAKILLDKIESSRYPSIPLNRLDAVLDGID